MMRKMIFIWIALATIILAGCWDQRLLRDHSLILSTSYDLKDDGTINKTVAFPKDSGDDSQQSTPAKQSEVVTTNGDSVKDAEGRMDQLIPQKFDRSKVKIVILGEQLASEGIFSPMDSLYRDLRGPLNAKVAITEGTAEEALNIKESYNRLISDFYTDILDSAEEAGLTKLENVQTICPIILWGGRDFVLPYIRIKEDGGSAIIDGVAMFTGDKMTGKLNEKETAMLLILSNQTSKGTKINLRVSNDKKDREKNFVDFIIRKVKRDFKVYVDNDHVKAEINLTLKIEIDEYPADHLYDVKRAKNLTKRIESKLNDLAVKTIGHMQEANSDPLGIGEKVSAYHHSTWDKINWDETYPEVPIETKIKVEIVRHGIIN